MTPGTTIAIRSELPACVPVVPSGGRWYALNEPVERFDAPERLTLVTRHGSAEAIVRDPWSGRAYRVGCAAIAGARR